MHNGTVNTLFSSRMDEISMTLDINLFKNWLFSVVVSLKKKQWKVYIRTISFSMYKNDNIFRNFD